MQVLVLKKSAGTDLACWCSCSSALLFGGRQDEEAWRKSATANLATFPR